MSFSDQKELFSIDKAPKVVATTNSDSSGKLVEILLPLPFDTTFHYRLLNPKPHPVGTIVTVPFHGRTVYGIIWNATPLPLEKPSFTIKKISSIVELPPIPSRTLAFIQWMSAYHACPLGLILKFFLANKQCLTPIKPIITRHYQLQALPETLRITQSRKAVIDYITHNPEQTKQDILQKTNISESVLRGLEKENIFSFNEIIEQPSKDKIIKEKAHYPELSEAQSQAANSFITTLQQQSHHTLLLDGVTGSGKTETYCEAIEHVLQSDTGQVLVLLPEIALTSQIFQRFEKRYGFSPSVWHSNQKQSARKQIWQGVLQGHKRLVIGARSALFLPFQNLRLIIVDEEHESSYKQEEGICYHGRDMAIARAFHEQIPVILASATPSLETWHNVEQGKYQKVTLPSRYGQAALPIIIPIDMRQEACSGDRWISPTLQQKLVANFEQSKQSMLYINRRGYAPLTICTGCGHKIACPHCTGWLSVHQKKDAYRLLCHYCGYKDDFPDQCSHCDADAEKIIAYGPGVQKIAKEVEAFLPSASIAIMTSDLIEHPEQLHQQMQAIIRGDVDIIIGTQLMAKGHHFPKLSLVGILDAELGASGGDLRGSEKTYQLLHQVAGRAGREADQGTVYIQTYQTDSTIIQALQQNDRDQFYSQEMAIRQSMHMPPFSRLVAVIVSAESEYEAQQTANHLRDCWFVSDQVILLGPAPAPIYRLRGRYRYRFLIQSPKNIKCQTMIKNWLLRYPLPNTVHIQLDIDPYGFL